MKLLRYTLLCALLGLPAGLSGQETKLTESAWYPLDVDTTWTYETSDGMADKKPTFTVKVVKHDKVGTTPCAFLDMTGDGRVRGSEALSVAADGVYRYATNGKTPDKPILILKLPPKKDMMWTIDSKVDGDPLKGTFKTEEAEVTVPAGKFKTIVVKSDDLDANGTKVSCSFFYAEGKGMVKQIIEIAGKTTTIELKEFKAGKK